MVESPDLTVQINNKSKCIYNNAVKTEGNDLHSLISNLKSMQQKVNEIITKLVQAEQSSIEGENLADDDESEENDDDSDDGDGNSEPKKCKYK